MPSATSISVKENKLSSEKIDVSNKLQEILMTLSLACSTMQLFAMVILLPFLVRFHHAQINSFEVGILIAACTVGELVACRFTEPVVSYLGTKWSLQLGFVFMIATSYAFWSISYIKNDMDFAMYAFIARMLNGIGSGLLRSVILIARA